MHYPTLQNIPSSREALSAFRGLNQQGDIESGEFAAMENMSAGSYPQAATCRAPAPFLPQAQPGGMLAKEKLCYVQGKSLVVGEHSYDLGLGEGPKKLVSMGAYILILPDKKYFNTADPEDFGDIEQVVEAAGWHLYPCDREGQAIVVDYITREVPQQPQDGQLWIDPGREPCMQCYHEASGVWAVVESFVALEMDEPSNPRWPYCDFFTDCFSTGDTVSLTFDGEALRELYHGYELESGPTTTAIWNLEDSHRVTVLGGMKLMFPGVLPERVAIGNRIRLTAPMPDMDFLFECGNRLWGCRYGERSGRFVNELYASRLGDFRNWTSFRGVSTDAYTASVGTDGPFTGAINYMGYPLFFKENCIHRVYGSYPSEYRVQTTPGRGVAPGCSESLCLLGDAALYLGKDGVCAYDGALPSLISQELRGLSGPATAAVWGKNYYLSTPDGLYVYDSRRRLWHRRSPIAASQMCTWNGHVLYFRRGETGLMEVENGPEAVAFSLETGILAGAQQQRVRAICLRYALHGWARVLVEYDSSGVWLAAGTLPETRLGWGHLPLKPRRCDHFRLKLCGEGSFRLHSIIKTLEKGSDLP